MRRKALSNVKCKILNYKFKLQSCRLNAGACICNFAFNILHFAFPIPFFALHGLKACHALVVVIAMSTCCASMFAVNLRVGTFKIDATPPLGSPLCDALVPPATGVNDPLSARGVVFKADDQQPVVLVAVDWVGIGNEGHDAWREAIATACKTTSDRVCVHSIHNHDAPGCDFLAESIAAKAGMPGEIFPVKFARETIANAANAAKKALADAQPATHIGYGMGRVEKVASNRRLLGPDGKVKHERMSSCKDPKVQALPEGLIDPNTRVVSFWQKDKPLVVMSYYATHPQSYYRTGKLSVDFVGMARDMREAEVPGPMPIHFNGAGGNVAAGKYNDGSPENRPVLAERLADGMKAAWESTQKVPLGDLDFDWQSRGVVLPVADWIDVREQEATLANKKSPTLDRVKAARNLAFARRCEAGHEISIGRLRIGDVDFLHLPGELFVEYQLAAQKLRPEGFVCTAAYGDYGSGYIGVAEAYGQGGYETGQASRVSPRVESVLMRAIQELMK